MLFAQILIRAPDVRLLNDLQAGPVSVERRPPDRLRCKSLAEKRESPCLATPGGGALVGGIGRSGRPFLKTIAFAVVPSLGRVCRPSEAEPIGRFLWLRGDRGREEGERSPGIAAPKRGLSIGSKLRASPASRRQPPLAPKSLLEANRIAGEVLAHEAFLGKQGCRGDEGAGENS